MKNPTTLQADGQAMGLPMARDIDWPLFLISGGFLGAFLLAALIDIDTVSALVNTLFAWSTKAFGLYWQVLMLATFAVSLFIGFSRCGRTPGRGHPAPGRQHLQLDRRDHVRPAGRWWRLLGRCRTLDALCQPTALLRRPATAQRSGGYRGTGAIVRALGLPGLGRAG